MADSEPIHDNGVVYRYAKLSTPKCPHCGGDMNPFLKEGQFHFGNVIVFEGCWTCLGKLILRGIAAIEKVDELERGLKALERKLWWFPQ